MLHEPIADPLGRTGGRGDISDASQKPRFLVPILDLKWQNWVISTPF